MLTLPHQRIRVALIADGWRIVHDAPFRSGFNPSRLILRKGRITRQLFIYAWLLKGEGRGRSGDSLRVQMTRGHEGDLVTPPGHCAMGLGWHEDYELFAAFDVWVKRASPPGGSSSAYFTRSLLESAQRDQWAEEERKDGPTCAFKPVQIGKYFSWLSSQEQRHLTRADPTDFGVDGDELTLRLDPRKDWRYFALRNHDYVVITRGNDLLDNSVWKVRSIMTDHQYPGGTHRAYLDLKCDRHGVIRDGDWFKQSSEER